MEVLKPKSCSKCKVSSLATPWAFASPKKSILSCMFYDVITGQWSPASYAMLKNISLCGNNLWLWMLNKKMMNKTVFFYLVSLCAEPGQYTQVHLCVKCLTYNYFRWSLVFIRCEPSTPPSSSTSPSSSPTKPPSTLSTSEAHCKVTTSNSAHYSCMFNTWGGASLDLELAA